MISILDPVFWDGSWNLNRRMDKPMDQIDANWYAVRVFNKSLNAVEVSQEYDTTHPQFDE
jgi:hypothetical protein